MNEFLTTLLAFIAGAWVFQAGRIFLGMSRLPRLEDFAPLPAEQCASVSILVAARDEAQKFPQALESLGAVDYPRLEVVAVDDRSTDATGAILDELAVRLPRIRPIHIRELPAGWLGKPHALQQAYEASGGDWLVFTDADVRFAPELLRRAMNLALAKNLDHLSLMPRTDMHTVGEKIACTSWMLGFASFVQPWKASDPRSRQYIGVGAFQLIRREVYEAIGTHRRLAMEVVDDMKLGKLVKLGGYRSGVALAEHWLGLHWQDGLVNIIRGLTKNTFAALGYKLEVVFLAGFAQFCFSILPFLALPFVSGAGFWFALAACAVPVLGQAAVCRHAQVSPLYGLTHPLGALIMEYILLRSTVVTLWHGGVTWRETFYPLEQLRKGVV